MDRNLIQKILLGLFLVACITIGIKKANFAEFDGSQTATNKPEINSNISINKLITSNLYK